MKKTLLLTFMALTVCVLSWAQTVCFNTTLFELDCHLDIPKSEEAQHYLAELIFNETECGVEEAYSNFLKLWKQDGHHVSKPAKGRISIDISKEYEQEDCFTCYHVKASLNGSAMLTGLPQNKETEKQKAHHTRHR